MTACELCGSAVSVTTADEGTSSYEPALTPERLGELLRVLRSLPHDHQDAAIHAERARLHREIRRLIPEALRRPERTLSTLIESGDTDGDR